MIKSRWEILHEIVLENRINMNFEGCTGFKIISGEDAVRVEGYYLLKKDIISKLFSAGYDVWVAKMPGDNGDLFGTVIRCPGCLVCTKAHKVNNKTVWTIMEKDYDKITCDLHGDLHHESDICDDFEFFSGD